MIEENNEKNRYTLAYIQQQERHIMDALREKFNLQIQIGGFAETIEKFKQMYKDSQLEVAKQNELMTQATFSIEKLTNDLKISEDVSNDRMKLISELNQKLVDYEQLKSVYSSAQKEIQRINNELSILHSENEQLSSQLSLAKSSIESYDQSSLAKKERPKTKKIVEDNSF